MAGGGGLGRAGYAPSICLPAGELAAACCSWAAVGELNAFGNDAETRYGGDTLRGVRAAAAGGTIAPRPAHGAAPRRTAHGGLQPDGATGHRATSRDTNDRAHYSDSITLCQRGMYLL